MSKSLLVAVAIALVSASIGTLDAQRKSTTKKKATPPPPPPLQTDVVKPTCPETLGTGVTTNATFCFVLAGRDPQAGVLVDIPRHSGDATLLFDLHNRHTYSEEDVRSGRGFSKYTAVIGVLGMDSTLIGRAAVQSEFRSAKDLYDRVSGGAGPGGMKAVAPLGRAEAAVTIPEGVERVSLLGEILDATTAAGRETATPGRTVAIVSNVRVEYRPAKPAAKTPAAKTPAKSNTAPAKKR